MIQVMTQEAAKARDLWDEYLKACAPASGKVWAPVLTDEQQKEHDAYVIANNLPF